MSRFNNVIIEWGSVKPTPNNTTIIFPLAYTSLNISISLQYVLNYGHSPVSYYNLTKTDFKIYNFNQGTQWATAWISVGY